MRPPVALLIAQIPGFENGYRKAGSGFNLFSGYFEVLERNSHIVYPALAVLVTLLLVAGILQAWRTQDLDGLAKVELKREIILELRRQMGGVSADRLSQAVGLENFKTVKLLEEMQRDGILISHTNTSRLTLWRIKGVGGGLGPKSNRA